MLAVYGSNLVPGRGHADLPMYAISFVAHVVDQRQVRLEVEPRPACSPTSWLHLSVPWNDSSTQLACYITSRVSR